LALRRVLLAGRARFSFEASGVFSANTSLHLLQTRQNACSR
jgi:hypothetical protein